MRTRVAAAAALALSVSILSQGSAQTTQSAGKEGNQPAGKPAVTLLLKASEGVRVRCGKVEATTEANGSPAVLKGLPAEAGVTVQIMPLDIPNVPPKPQEISLDLSGCGGKEILVYYRLAGAPAVTVTGRATAPAEAFATAKPPAAGAGADIQWTPLAKESAATAAAADAVRKFTEAVMIAAFREEVTRLSDGNDVIRRTMRVAGVKVLSRTKMQGGVAQSDAVEMTLPADGQAKAMTVKVEDFLLVSPKVEKDTTASKDVFERLAKAGIRCEVEFQKKEALAEVKATFGAGPVLLVP